MSQSEPGGRLPSHELEEIFRGPILDDLLLFTDEPVPEPNRPAAVLLLAQPGAVEAMANLHLIHGQIHPSGVAPESNYPGGVILLDPDTFRAYHPRYFDLRTNRPQDLDAETDADVMWWVNRATDYLMARRFNVLVERPWDSTDAFDLTLQRCEAAGYDVHVAALAVPDTLSRLVLVESFVRQAERVGTGRWISPELHDHRYDLLPDLLSHAEASTAVSHVTVQTRDGVVHDMARQIDGRWPARSPAAAEVLIDAQTEMLTRTQRTALSNRLSSSLDRLANAGVVHVGLYDVGAEIAYDLAPTASGAGPIKPLAEALADLDTANAALDALTHTAEPDPGPDIEPPPPEIGPEPSL